MSAPDDPYGHFAPGPCPSRYCIEGPRNEVVPCGRPGPHDGTPPYGMHRTAGAHFSWTNAASVEGRSAAADHGRTQEPTDWCYTCEQLHGPMGWGDGCTDDSDLAREKAREQLPWAGLTRRCRARREKRDNGWFGRCELRAGHAGDHALDRGMDTPRWSTEWTR